MESKGKIWDAGSNGNQDLVFRGTEQFELPHDKNQQNDCVPNQPGQAQSDQSLRCPHEESLGPYLPTECAA